MKIVFSHYYPSRQQTPKMLQASSDGMAMYNVLDGSKDLIGCPVFRRGAQAFLVARLELHPNPTGLSDAELNAIAPIGVEIDA